MTAVASTIQDNFCYSFQVLVRSNHRKRPWSTERSIHWIPSIASIFLVFTVASQDAQAGGRQLHGSAMAGGGIVSTPTELFVGGAIGGQIGYGITDAFRTYAQLEYRFGASLGSMSTTLTHHPSVVVGFGYSLDVLSVVPWIAVELRAGLRAQHSGAFAFVPGAGARVGVDWLLQRYFSLTFQAAYTLSWVDSGLAHDASVLLGPRWVLDL